MKNKTRPRTLAKPGVSIANQKSFIRAGNGIERRSGKDRMSRPAGSLPRCLWAIQPVRKRRICLPSFPLQEISTPVERDFTALFVKANEGVLFGKWARAICVSSGESAVAGSVLVVVA